MNTPIFLTLNEVLQLHAYQIETYGGSNAILDMGKLESAIAQPSAAFGGRFLNEDIAAMAAANLFGIVKNHAFEDGNKRTGTHAAIAFLAMNNYSIELPVDEAEVLVLRVAKGEAGKEEVARFFRDLLTQQYGTVESFYEEPES